MLRVVFATLALASLCLTHHLAEARDQDEILIPRYILDAAEGHFDKSDRQALLEVERFSPGTLPEGFVAQDFDGDGLTDLLVAAVDKYAKSGRSLMVWRMVTWTAQGAPVYINCSAQYEGSYEVPPELKALIEGE